MKIRIKFAKYGVMKFIGHLDVMRFFQKAIRRADIDIRFSEGFSPHPVMSFAAPLGVGMESLGEYLDIEVNSMTSAEEMKDALNREMADGFLAYQKRKMIKIGIAAGLFVGGLSLSFWDAEISMILFMVVVILGIILLFSVK